MPKGRKHVFPSQDLNFPRTLHEDKHRFEQVEIPVVTISASFMHNIFSSTGEKSIARQDVVFSRAHYSMAVAILTEAQKRDKPSWLIDPINYISNKDWEKIKFIEKIGQITARNKFFKKIKNILEVLARNRLPISKAVKEPLLYVTSRTTKFIISLHYEAGNILAQNNRHVLQIVTDPHVHDNYLLEADRKNIFFAVFDEKTRVSFLEKAKQFRKEVSPEQIVITGPPVDPRIIDLRKNKKKNNWEKRELRIVITTSGLGTNKSEIKKILKNLLPNIQELNIKLILYAGTHQDFYEMFIGLCSEYKIPVGEKESKETVRVVYETNIIEANQALIDYAFSWADCFITKPSGDMAYDAVASGCFLLTLEPWGEWEENIEQIFTNLNVAKKAETNNFSKQIANIKNSKWAQDARKNLFNIDKIYLEGAKNIVDLQHTLQYNE